MPVKALLAFVAAPLLASASVPETFTIVNHPAVVQVVCERALGTAFKIGTNVYASVDHVTRNKGCTINGEPIVVTYADTYRDFSVLRAGAVPGAAVTVNCGGFRDGQTYWAVGYARGLPVQRMVTVRQSDAATKAFNWNWMSVLLGAEQYIPGMSGGIVMDANGEAVGLVNGYHLFASLSFSRSLYDTPLCDGRR